MFCVAHHSHQIDCLITFLNKVVLENIKFLLLARIYTRQSDGAFCQFN